MKDEVIELLIDKLVHSIKEFQGNEMIEITVIGIIKLQQRSPFEAPTLEDQLQDKADEDDEIQSCEPRHYMYPSGRFSHAYEDENGAAVVMIGPQYLILDESYNKFCKRVGWVK